MQDSFRGKNTKDSLLERLKITLLKQNEKPKPIELQTPTVQFEQGTKQLG